MFVLSPIFTTFLIDEKSILTEVVLWFTQGHKPLANGIVITLEGGKEEPGGIVKILLAINHTAELGFRPKCIWLH